MSLVFSLDVSDPQVLCWGPWSIWCWILCRMTGKDLAPFCECWNPVFPKLFLKHAFFFLQSINCSLLSLCFDSLILLHCSVCLFLCQYYEVFMTMTLWYNLKSIIVVPATGFFFPDCFGCHWSFMLPYKLLDYFFEVFNKALAYWLELH